MDCEKHLPTCTPKASRSFGVKVNGWCSGNIIKRRQSSRVCLYLITGLVRRASLASIINFSSLFFTLFRFIAISLLRVENHGISFCCFANVYLSIMPLILEPTTTNLILELSLP